VIRRSGDGVESSAPELAAECALMGPRLAGLFAAWIVCAAWFVASPLIGFSRFAHAIAARDAAAMDQRADFARLGRSLAPQIVWAYLTKTGRVNTLGRAASSIIAGSSASLADAILGEMLNPEAVLSLLDSGQPGGKLQLSGGLAALPNGSFGSVWQAFQNAEYGLGHFYLSAPASALPTDQYWLHMQVLQWNWKLGGIDLPEKVRDQLADELIRRIGK
jgi:DUF2939 family protein